MEFYINDRIREKKSGLCGVIIDKVYSEAKAQIIYFVKFDELELMEMRTEEELEKYILPKEYKVETQIADNIVIGIIYEIDGDSKTEVCRGHGHIIHDGAEGIAQACAFAYKRAFLQIDSGIYMKQRRGGRSE